MTQQRFDFHDQMTNGPGSFLLRSVESGIGVSITTEKNGDIEVILSAAEYSRLLDVLRAVSI